LEKRVAQHHFFADLFLIPVAFGGTIQIQFRLSENRAEIGAAYNFAKGPGLEINLVFIENLLPFYYDHMIWYKNLINQSEYIEFSGENND